MWTVGRSVLWSVGLLVGRSVLLSVGLVVGRSCGRSVSLVVIGLVVGRSLRSSMLEHIKHFLSITRYQTASTTNYRLLKIWLFPFANTVWILARNNDPVEGVLIGRGGVQYKNKQTNKQTN